MNYELRLFDEIVLKFNIERNSLGEYVYKIDSTTIFSSKLPIGLKPDNKSLQGWLASRVIPKNREFVDQILFKAGLSHNDTMGIINICKGLSLNDSYWVVEEGFKGLFSDYNLYDHNFTRVLSLIAYTGYGSHSKKGFTSSPEFTTNGMLKKCWRREKGIYLYKGGTSGAANTGMEPYSEFYASEIADTLELPHVKYNLAKWKGELCSTCELFTSKTVSYIPVYRFLDSNSLSDISNFIKSLGESFYKGFTNMLIFDCLIYNTDRHYGNFGLLVDSYTNQPVGMAPIFDNGLSLFNYAMMDDLENIEDYAKTRMPCYNGITYDDILRNFLTDEHKVLLKKMIGFHFKKHSKYNWDSKRMKRIEDFLQKRVRYILDFKI